MDEIYLCHHKATSVHLEALQTFSFHAEKFWKPVGSKGAERDLRSQRYKEAILARLGANSSDRFYCFLDASDAMRALFFSHYVHSIRHTGKNHILFAGVPDQIGKEFEALLCVCKQVHSTLGAIKKEMNPRVSMLSISLSEFGVIPPIAEIALLCKEWGVLLHVDVGNAIGKIPIEFHRWNIDFLTGEGSLCGSLPGSAWLIAKEKTVLPLSKDNPLPLLASLATALEESIDQMDSMQLDIASKRGCLEAGIPGAKVLFTEENRLPNVSVLSFPSIHQEVLLFFLKQKQLYVERVDVERLSFCGIDLLTAQGAVCFSLASTTTQEEIDRAVVIVKDAFSRLQRVSFVPELGAPCKVLPVQSFRAGKKLLSLLENLRHAGFFTQEEGEGKGMRAICVTVGSLHQAKALKLSLLIDESDAVIADAKFQAYGSPLLLGLGEATCAFLVRKNLGQMARITAEIIEKQLQDQPSERAFGDEGSALVNLVLEAIEKIEEQCQDLLDKHFEPPTPLTPSLSEKKSYPGWEILSKEEKMGVIEEVVAADIRPYIELDEGGITVIDLIEKEVVISYQGACTTCYSSVGSTLNAIQTILREKVSPDLTVRPDTSLFHQSF